MFLNELFNEFWLEIRTIPSTVMYLCKEITLALIKKIKTWINSEKHRRCFISVVSNIYPRLNFYVKKKPNVYISLLCKFAPILN